jgi:deoxyribonuclease-1-like protein
MKKPLLALVLAALAGGWLLLKHFDIEGLDRIKLKPRDAATAAGGVPVRGGPAIRIASFNIQVFGTSKASKPEVMQVLAEIVRRFDIVAIQEIRSQDETLLPRFVDLVNATGRHYDYVIGPRLGRTVSKEQYAYVFDAATIEVDRSAVYTVDDPDDLLHRPPLVAPFRCRGPPPDEAFTFTLINIHTDPDETATELDALADVFRAVQNDGRGEDDIILLGDLNVDDRKLGRLGQIPNVMPVLVQTPTNTRGTKMYDNILFNRVATVEFMGRAGVVDLMSEFNLTLEAALAVSDHLPVWAEFSVYEGGQAGRVATRPAESAAR